MSRLNSGKPLKRYEVTVEDSIDKDGKYTVDARNTHDAMCVCKRLYNIENTQGGVSYTFRLIKHHNH